MHTQKKKNSKCSLSEESNLQLEEKLSETSKVFNSEPMRLFLKPLNTINNVSQCRLQFNCISPPAHSKFQQIFCQKKPNKHRQAKRKGNKTIYIEQR